MEKKYFCGALLISYEFFLAEAKGTFLFIILFIFVLLTMQ